MPHPLPAGTAPEHPPAAIARGWDGRLAQAIPGLCVALGLAALLVPVALTPVPPLLDYPNHLARMWLLAGGVGVPPLDAMYAVNWAGAWTNIGIDLLAATVGRLTGGLALGPWVVGAAVVLPPLGAVLLNRAVFGSWHWWQAGFAVLAWNATLLLGFLNFQIGIGLALMAAALDAALLRRLGAINAGAARIGIGTALLAVHPFGTGLYGVLVAALAHGNGQGNELLIQRLLRAALAGAPAVCIPAAALLFLAPALPGGTVPVEPGSFWRYYYPAVKITTMMTAVTTYHWWFDLAAVVLLWAVARVISNVRLFRCHTGLMLAATGLGLLALLCPSELGGTAYMDWRFPIMALLALVAATQPNMTSTRAGSWMAMGLFLLTSLRTASVGEVWHERQADVAALRDVLTLVPAGAAIAPVTHYPSGRAAMPPGRQVADGLPTSWHLPALAVPWRHAFVPTLFTKPGKQPLRVRFPWSSIAVYEGFPAPSSFLRVYPSAAFTDYSLAYMQHWRDRFDYVLVLNPAELGTADEASVPGLELLADRGFVQLYRVHHAE